jgi:hypothetical protein
MKDARLLVRALAEPASLRSLVPRQWTGLIAMARAESLLGSLACRAHGTELPPGVAALFEAARVDSSSVRNQALWEVEMARRALAGVDSPIILLKGSAFAASELAAAEGRSIGDLDILVPRDRLAEVERALLDAGWEWVKQDDYDDLYYRRWMHELPPLIHRSRDRMIDVHHNILPLTARPSPDAAALIEDSVPLASGLRVLSPEDMIVHAAAHLFADGDLTGGLRNLWDIDRLLREFGQRQGFWQRLSERARRHGLEPEVKRALRMCTRLYFTPVDPAGAGRRSAWDRLFERRLLARNDWGQATRPALRFGFYLRSHWLRMPPLLLARHLFIKSRGRSAKRPSAAPADYGNGRISVR